MRLSKRMSVVGMLLIGAISVVGCSSNSEPTTTASGATTNNNTSSSTASETTSNTSATVDTANSGYTDWEEKSGIFITDETEAELYEKAKEEGSVVLYSISSRCETIAEAFNEKYPGVICEPYDISSDELLEKVTREHAAGRNVADVVHIKDQDGTLYNEYVQNKIFYNYQPDDIMEHIDPAYSEYVTPVYIELTQLFYNGEAYPDGAPVDTLWDLTREEWNGKIVMQNPVDNSSLMSWIAGFTFDDTAQELADLYEVEFGEPLVLSAECPNAGYEFLKQLKANDLVYTTSSDEASEAIGTRGQTNPPIGFAASSKMRKNESNDWVLEPVNVLPNTGVPQINGLYMVEGSEHTAAAKLLIRFIMGGDDGTSEGYEPFNTLGGWPVRDDIQPVDGVLPLSELNLGTYDPMATYDVINDVYDFWLMLP
ncbi:MAG: hypothetical protein ATN35_05500 [Epulopiscium sp. Nele67-Bin004]|nr:MAG: hypothetical protein ATN35_05500 [Epulopiscium sp. Nele67-Bin004]